MRINVVRYLALPAALAVTVAAINGCSPGRYFDGRPVLGAGPIDGDATSESADPIRGLPMFSGHDGRALAWADLMDAVAWADVVFLGEQHDDEVAHATQREIVAETFSNWRPCALSLEMLERDEQPLVSDYFEGIIDAKQFARLTNSENWGAKGRWHETYQPIIDAARTADGRVIAANAPRRYVRLARLDGYERLAALPSRRRQLVDYPARLPVGGYRDRFWELMKQADRPESADEGEEPRVLTDDEVEALFRSQLVWDATMAASVSAAKHGGAKKVVHLIGQFHTDFEGGTVLEFRKRQPSARVLVVSLQRAMPSALLEEDRGRADVVIYTGERPPDPPEDEAEVEGEAEAEAEIAEPEPPSTQPDETEPAATQPAVPEPPASQPARVGSD